MRSGVYTAAEIRGIQGRAGFESLVRDGTARRLRHGWYAVGDAPGDVVRAVARGGVLSCVSALGRAGVWVPKHHDLHVRGNRWAVQNLPGPFCRRFGRPESEYGAVDDLPTALAYAARCLDDGGFVVVCDSLLNTQLMSSDEIEYRLRHAPKRIHRLLARCDARSESGPETMLRVWLRSRNVRVRIQVPIPRVGRVDLLVGDYLIIEIDGWEYHADRSHFSGDRVRDVDAHAHGYTPLRFTYGQIVFDWDVTTAKIMDAVRNGAHLRPSRLV